ncbi:GGDEF domain-containing protein [uncultured Desulfovibrio sp.]|uniref:GGDEF domain-containing protein n=1 Tax=uncultured Desulfovibrio sp. TaxID=167968 RepID=UPI00261F611A|nr:GGDEF domain-containing protein [uncultured Desulfovibrio sp.]
MSKHAEFESLARELRTLREHAACDAAEEQADNAMLVVRLVRGLSRQRWQDFCRAFPLSQWCAMPMPDAAPEAHVADLRADAQQQAPLVMPEALVGTLSAELLMAQLQRELLRQARSGGNLSLLCAALSERRRLCVALGEGTVKRLERLLAESLRDKLEACDSMGDLGHGRYMALLPGLGQLKARCLAERLQADFAEQARPLFPTGGISAGAGAQCALGVVCVGRGEQQDASDLMDKAAAALNVALEQEAGHIQQEVSTPLGDRTTLVHSSEKRFLFFGGE